MLRLVAERNADRALSRLTREPFDAVALDLPPRQALELASRVRSAQPGVVILLVPSGDAELKREAIRAGADAVVTGARYTPARLSLLETTLETLRLAALNRRLCTEAWKTAGSLAEAFRESQALRAHDARARASSRPPVDR
ncbi:MAG TPA: response regulator [Planctomycetota bacterium]|nr:response regulator [Planctomycetota bacterium]